MVIHAVAFVCVVFTAPVITPTDLECQPVEPGQFCLSSFEHTLLLAGRDIGGVWLRKLFLLADLPAVLGVAAIAYPLGIPATPAAEISRSWLYAVICLGLGTMQWWVIGAVLTRKGRPRVRPSVM